IRGGHTLVNWPFPLTVSSNSADIRPLQTGADCATVRRLAARGALISRTSHDFAQISDRFRPDIHGAPPTLDEVGRIRRARAVHPAGGLGLLEGNLFRQNGTCG